jgi:predicted dithiol-disulfide oxidoreductase (DUF899 family)
VAEGAKGVPREGEGLGRKTLAELFGGRSQLVVYHFIVAVGALAIARALRPA